ncbi:MAG: type II toxin-antitoxin system VapC family toxin [Gammaproteobacteria bacterium]|nr:type II toxin-antitoxin system VapC family toxin [Gammaproteobacteria bacterium]
MTEAVLDASALLAWLDDEPGAEAVLDVLGSGSAAMSAVNWAEVLAKLVDRGVSEDDRRRIRGSLDIRIRPFDEEAALTSASMRQATRRLGLSIGERACLGLGLVEGLPVLTADRAWAKLEIGVDITVIR